MEIQVGELIKKAKVSRCGDGDYPVLSMTMHDGLMFQNDRFKKQIASVDQSNYQVVKRHQLVESFPIDEGVLAVQELTEEGIVSPAYKIWDVNMDRVIPVYLELALRSHRSIEYYKSKLRGTTARRRSITDTEFCAMQINLPDLKEQERIVEIISKTRTIATTRRRELDTLDELIKARFVELFGDPISNPKGWDMVELGELTGIGSSKRIFEKEYVSDGIPFYRTKEIVELSKGNSISTELYISEERFTDIKEQFGVPKAGDLLISAVGTIGVIWIVDGKNDFYFKDGNIIRVDGSEMFDSIYMKNLLENLISEYKKQMSAGTAYAALTISGLTKMKVYNVPMELQIDFADFVKQVDKSKVAVQKSLDEIHTLFDSLMQEYFG